MFNLIIYTYIIYKYMYIYTCTVYIHIHILYVHTHTFEVIYSEGFYTQGHAAPECKVLCSMQVDGEGNPTHAPTLTPSLHLGSIQVEATPPRSHLHYTWAACRWRPRPPHSHLHYTC